MNAIQKENYLLRANCYEEIKAQTFEIYLKNNIIGIRATASGMWVGIENDNLKACYKEMGDNCKFTIHDQSYRQIPSDV